jgi:hypothetical protein
MKKLMQVDLSTLATPVEPKKRPYKKRKVEPPKEEEEKEEEEEERPVKGVKTIPPKKEKKPPTEKQLAARERMKQARLDKIAAVKAEKEKLEEEIRAKAEEVARKKAELAEKRRIRREEKKKMAPQLPVKTSEPGQAGKVDPPKPTISQTLAKIEEASKVEEPLETIVEEEEVPQTPEKPFIGFSPSIINAPKREDAQRFRNYPFGRAAPPAPPRFR